MTRSLPSRPSWVPIGLVVPLALGSAMMTAPCALAQAAAGAGGNVTPADNSGIAPAADANGVSAPDASGVSDVVVAAPSQSKAVIQKEQAQPTPATVLTPEQLQADQITNVQEAQKLAPDLQIRILNVRNVAINIRGLGQASANALDGIEDGVAVYLDDVYQARPGASIFDIPSLESIVVKKGPQGTTGGADSTGGAIYVTTRLPSFKPEAYGEVSLGNYGYYNAQVGASSRMFDSDKAVIRLDGLMSDYTGYVTNVLNNQKYQDWRSAALRGQVLLLPADNLTVRLIADYNHVDTECCVYPLQSVLTNYANGAPYPNNFYQRAARLSYIPLPAESKPYAVALNTATRVIQETAGASLHIAYDWDGYKLSSISAASLYNFWPHNDQDMTGLSVTLNAAGQIHQKQATQEFRLESPRGQRVEYTTGLFYFWEQVEDDTRYWYGNQAGAYINNPKTAAQLNTTNVALTNLNIISQAIPITNSVAGYGNATFHATPKLDLIAGLRETYEWKGGSFNQYQAGALPLSLLSPANALIAQTQRNALGRAYFDTASVSNGLFSALATAAYHLTPETQVYATYSRGAKSGGVNLVNLPAGAPATVLPEFVDNYEVGVKNAFYDNRLLLNAAAYWMNDHNYQTTAASIANGITQAYLANAKSVISRGLELDVRATPVEGLTTFANVSYDDAYYNSFANSPCPIEWSNKPTCNLSGSAIALAPLWAAAVGAEYRHRIGVLFNQEMVGYTGFDYTWQSEFFSNPDASRYAIVPAYGLLNLHAGITPESGRWDLSAWVHNAADSKYVTQQTVWSPTSGAIGAQVGQPITFGITFRAKI